MHFWEVIERELSGDSWLRVSEIFLAFFLTSLIGLEREMRLKSAGLRTHALVGMGSALMMLVSKYGFTDIIASENVSLDPSRVASQIVSGIGFIGGGLIFVRKDIVHGLTTAATVWVAAGVGMACGASLPLLALSATLGHFIIAIGYTRVMHRVLGVTNRLNVRYNIAGADVAARVLSLCTAYGFTIRGFNMKAEFGDPKIANLIIRVQGSKSIALLSEKILDVPEVISIQVNASKEDD